MSKQEKKILAKKIALSVVIGTLMSSGIAMAADKTGSVTIDNGTSGNVYGCVAIDHDNVKNSTLIVNGGRIAADGLYGGQAEHGNAVGNKVTINGGTFDPADSELSLCIYGGYIEEGTQQGSTVSTASGNSVTVNGGMFKSGETRLREANVFGGYIVDGIGTATGNTVTIGSAKGDQITTDDRFNEIRAGSACGAEARGNAITIYDGYIYGVDGGFSYRGGNVIGNTANIYGGTIDYVIGGEARDGGDAINNEVIISGGVINNVYGGGAYDGGDATGNTVTVNDGDIYAVDGGYAINGGSAIDNKIIVNGGTVKWVMGGETRGEGDATDNEVIINGGVTKNVYGGIAYDDGDATGNQVLVSGGAVDNVFGGTAANGNSANGNIVTVTGGTFERVYDEANERYDAAGIYGGYIYEGNGNAIGNTVTIGSKEDNKITDKDYFEYVCGGINENEGEIKDNTVTIYGGNIDLVEGGYTYSGNVTGNTVNISGGNIDWACGGYAENGGNVTGNTVNISGGTFTDSEDYAGICGGYIWSGIQYDDGTVSTVSGNKVVITDGVFGVTDDGDATDVYGGFISKGVGNVVGNTVTIGSGEDNKITAEDRFDYVVGGRAYTDCDVTDNTVTIYGGSFDRVDGGYCYSGEAADNTVTIYDGSFDRVNGGYAYSGGNAANNTVNISGGTFSSDLSGDEININGGRIWEGKQIDTDTVSTASNNAVNISGGVFNRVYINGGSVSEGIGDAVGNTVTITDGVFKANQNGLGTTRVRGGIGTGNVTGNKVTIGSSVTNKITNDDVFYHVFGGYGVQGSVISENEVTIYGGTFDGYIAGGIAYTTEAISAYSNTVTICGGDITKADLIGAAIYTKEQNGYRITGVYGGKDKANTLNFGMSDSAYSGSVKSIQGFDVINFNSLDWNESTAPVTTGSLHLNPTDGTQFTVGNIYANGDKIADGSTMTLIASDSDITGDIRDTSVTATVYDGIAKVYQNAESTVTKGDQTIDLTIGSLGTATRNDQILVLGSSRATATAFVNQGEELIELSMDSLRRTQTDGETQIFAAVQGSNTDYDIKGSIDVNGWNSIVGIGKKTNNGTSYGIFFETGDGDYNIDNPYYGVRGDGEAEYNGGGIFLRKDNKNGLYTEGAIRIGNLSNKLDHAVRSGSDIVGYDINTLYYGAHIGIGKIIPVGKNDLDVYGKLLYTHHDSERFSIDGTDVRFDSVDSQRLRLGARMNHAQTDKLSLYYGAAWEYEFDGDAEGRADIFGLGDRSFGGSTLIGELGMNYKATDKWTLDFNFRGYDGQREGISGTLHLNCAF